MNPIWDDLIAAVVVASAVAYLARRAWRLLRSKRAAAACTLCAQCPSEGKSPPVVVPLQQLKNSTDPHRDAYAEGSGCSKDKP